MPPIWYSIGQDTDGDIFYRGFFQLSRVPESLQLAFTSDDGIEIWMNGVPAGSWGGGCHGEGCINRPYYCTTNEEAAPLEVRDLLRPGTNLIAAHVSSGTYHLYFNASFLPWKMHEALSDCEGPAGWTTRDFDDASWNAVAVPYIRTDPPPESDLYFRSRFELALVPRESYAKYFSEDKLRLYINERLVLQGDCHAEGMSGTTTGENVSSFLVPGVNVIAAHVSNATGATAFDFSLNANYNSQNLVNFEANPDSGVVPLTVSFTDRSVLMTNLAWDFGDQTTSTEQDPVHTYEKAGDYSVTLSATGFLGGGKKSKSLAIAVIDVLDADFTAETISGLAPLEVRFTDTSRGTSISSWAWSFGDGGASSLQHPTYKYLSPGTYTVRLTVNGFMASDFEEKVGFIVVEKPEVRFQRGDPNADGSVDIVDVVHILSYLFLSGAPIDCEKSADVNDDGSVDIADPIFELFSIFLSAVIPGPAGACGLDLTEDSLTCESFPRCNLP